MKSWIRTNRGLLITIGVLVLGLALLKIGYVAFGHRAVDAMYEGRAPGPLKGVIEGTDVYPVEKYYLEADLAFARLFGVARAVVALLAGLLLLVALLRPFSRRKILAVAAVAVVLVAGSNLFNRVRVGTGDLGESAEAVIARVTDVSERAATFDAAQALAALGPSPVNGYGFRFDDRLSDARVGYPAQREAPQTGPVSALRFEFDGTESPTFVLREGESEITGEGTLLYDTRPGDFLYNDEELMVPVRNLGIVQVRMRVDRGSTASLSWSEDYTPDPVWARHTVAIKTITDGQYHVYSINATNLFRRETQPAEFVRTIYFRPSDAAGAEVEIDYIRFLSKRERYDENPLGVTYETLGGEMRRVIHQPAPLDLTWDLDLPDEPLQLTFGLGILESGDPVRFGVEVREGSAVESVFAATVETPEGWVDGRVDLSRWRGRRIELVLRSDSDRGNIAFWSNPLLHAPPSRPLNVVVILEDTFRADRLSCLGYERETTPIRDAWVKDGALFRRAISQATKTRPSVPSLMTGLLPTATGVWTFSETLAESYLTLAEIFRSQGFETAVFLQNPNAGPYAGMHQGFGSVFDDRLLGVGTADLYGEELDAWLDAQAGRNFFLYLHLADPHGPYEPPPPHDRWYREGGDGGELVPREEEMDPAWVEIPTAEGRRNLYDGEIRNNDEWFGRFLEKLESRGIRDETLIVFLSDHGEQQGEHGAWGHQPPGYWVGLHVPLLMVYPPGIPGAVVDAPVQVIDIAPTLLELAGVDASGLLLHGESLLPLVRGENPEYWENRLCVSEEVVNRRKTDAGGYGSLLFRDWHLLHSKELPTPGSFLREVGLRGFPHFGLDTRVFDVRRNPSEQGVLDPFLVDFSTKRSARKILAEIDERNAGVWSALSRGGSEEFDLDVEVQDRLRALGYLK